MASQHSRGAQRRDGDARDAENAMASRTTGAGASPHIGERRPRERESSPARRVEAKVDAPPVQQTVQEWNAQPNVTDADSICFFTHKGGVGKTTSCYHFAWYLAQQHHKIVLAFDFDAQCNLTQLAFEESREDADWRNGIPGGDVYQALLPIHNEGPQMFFPASAVQVKADRFLGRGAFFIVPGSMYLSRLEAQVAMAHGTSNVLQALANSPGSIQALIKATARKYHADIVVIDLGPHAGELNFNIIMSSDFFLTPVGPDAFSLQSLKLMTSIFPEWVQKQRRISADTRERIFPFKSTPPKFLGLTYSRFNMAYSHQTPAKNYAYWFKEIRDYLTSQFHSLLQDNGMCNTAPRSGFDIGNVSEFHSMGRIAQRLCLPVFGVLDDDLMTAGADGELTSAVEKRERKRLQNQRQRCLDETRDAVNALLRRMTEEKQAAGARSARQ